MIDYRMSDLLRRNRNSRNIVGNHLVNGKVFDRSHFETYELELITSKFQQYDEITFSDRLLITNKGKDFSYLNSF